MSKTRPYFTSNNILLQNLTLNSDIRCPIDVALKYLNNKWTFHIIRDLFFGIKNFTLFLKASPGLTGKVLSDRLEELRENGIIEKKIIKTWSITSTKYQEKDGHTYNVYNGKKYFTVYIT